MDWTERAAEIIRKVDAKAKAIVEGTGAWNDNIIGEMNISVGFEMNDVDREFLGKYVAWRRDNPLA